VHTHILAVILAVILLVLTAVIAPLAVAGDPPPPPTLNGQAFTITFVTEKGKPHDKLTFLPDGASCPLLGPATLKITYAYATRNTKVIEFSGKITDAKGAVIELSGSASGTDIHGTITVTPKDDDPTARNFSGTRLAKN
jgi:hypothetical protein